MRKLLNIIKISASQILYRSGLLNLIAQSRLRNRVLVLTYHRVIDEGRQPTPDSNPGIIVSAESFDMQMRALKHHFNPVTLAEFHRHATQGVPLPAKSCLVTFDDGWLDNFEVAYPILRKYQIPAVIFLPLDYISNDIMFWQEEMLMWLTTLLNSGDDTSRERLADLLGTGKPAHTVTVDDIRRHVVTIKDRSDSEISAMLDALRKELGQSGRPAHYNHYMTWEQVEKMRAAGIEFASHALSHRVLCRMSDERCRHELTESRKILGERLGEPVLALAYPNGDHGQREVQEARAAGYELAFATTSGHYDRTVDDAFSIPRMNIHENNSRSEAQFLCSGLNLF